MSAYLTILKIFGFQANVFDHYYVAKGTIDLKKCFAEKVSCLNILTLHHFSL